MSSPYPTTIHTIQADGVKVFYREAGPVNAPVLLALHGFPSSSYQYRSLLAGLSDKYRVIAPDLPGFGFTVVAEDRQYQYTFANLTKTIEAFIDTLNLKEYALYLFDYGAPVGFRLAVSRPQAIAAIISQNGNAFDKGLGPGWSVLRAFWADPTEKKRESLRAGLTQKAIKSQYTTGESSASSIPPETYFLDYSLITRPGNLDIQLDLRYDYRTNVDLYPAFQDYLRKCQPPLLAIWGKNDGIFVPAGAEAFKAVLPDAEIKLVDGGHFALELHSEEIMEEIRGFFERNGI